jgi:TolA-binding protein
VKKQIKISKREIKEDKFTTFMLVAKDYIMANWLYAVGAVAAVVVIVGAVKLIQSQAGKSELEAADIFNRALTEVRSNNYPLAIVDFKKIVDDFGSSEQADIAAFNLGNAYLANKDYMNAKTAFEDFLKRGSDDKFFVTSAISGIGDCLAGTGDLTGAAVKYREAAEKYPDFKPAANYYVKAMLSYLKAGNIESARVVYAKIAKDFEGTPAYIESQRLAGEYNIQI